MDAVAGSGTSAIFRSMTSVSLVSLPPVCSGAMPSEPMAMYSTSSASYGPSGTGPAVGAHWDVQAVAGVERAERNRAAIGRGDVVVGDEVRRQGLVDERRGVVVRIDPGGHPVDARRARGEAPLLKPELIPTSGGGDVR